MQILTPEESVLLRLVREEPLAQALRSCEKGEIARLASMQKVLSPLSDRLLNEEGIDEGWKRVGAAFALGAEMERSRFAKALKDSVALLASVGIGSVVIKGISLAMGKARDCGDIDLLISESDLQRAISAFEEAGYQYAGFERNRYIRKSEYRDWRRLSQWSIQFEFIEPSTGILVELHTAFFETGRMYTENLRGLRAAIPEFIADSVIDPETGYRFLAVEDRALLLAFHAGMKRSPSNKCFVLRHILDLDALICAGLNWNSLIEKAARFKASHHLLLLLKLFEDATGAPLEQGILADVESSLDDRSIGMVRLHLRCLKSLGSYSTLSCFLYQLKSPFVFPSTTMARLRAGLILPLVLPPPRRLAQEYRLPIRSPLVYLLYLLEPFRWLLRIIRKILRALVSRIVPS